MVIRDLPNLFTGLCFLLVSCTSRAQTLPARATLEIRLSTPTGSRISYSGERVEATVISPVTVNGELVIPRQSSIYGSVTRVNRFGYGLKQATASIQYSFDTLRVPGNNPIPIKTELLSVETAKERVDLEGVVHGIHPVASLSASLAFYPVSLLITAPAIGVPIWAIKSLVVPPADPEIYFPAGTEFILSLESPLDIPRLHAEAKGILALSAEEVSRADKLLNNPVGQRANMGKRPADLVNVLLFGSREQIELAFRAAGWSSAERKSPLTLYRMYYALTRRNGYRMAPMNALTLAGARSDLMLQKNLDTVEKRHHVRLWKESSAKNLWLGTAAQDVAFRFELTHWTHIIDPRIDRERAKVTNDLVFTGCIEAGGLLARNSQSLVPLYTGAGSLLVTDGEVAALRLNDCRVSTSMPGLGVHSSRSQRLPHTLLALRDDLGKSNIAFTAYNTLKFATERHRISRRLRKYPDTEATAPGLSWLRSVPGTPRDSARQ